MDRSGSQDGRDTPGVPDRVFPIGAWRLHSRLVYAFEWVIPGSTERRLALTVNSRHGWFGRKRLELNGQVVFRRGNFSGIAHRWFDQSSGEELRLSLVQDGPGGIWRPALLVNGIEIPEATGAGPPEIIPPPKPIAVTAAVVYVLILMALVNTQTITKILNALYLNQDVHRFVMDVRPADGGSDQLRVNSTQLSPLRAYEPLHANLAAVGGSPPYMWERGVSGWPRGISIDSKTGALSGAPVEPRDFSGVVTVKDAAGQEATGAFAVRVNPNRPVKADQPAIEQRELPPATAGEPYSFQLTATGGRPAKGAQEPAYAWSTLGKFRLPAGLSLDSETGVISGTPTSAGARVVAIRVEDSSFSAWHILLPWVIPTAATAFCLLGLLQMRRGSIFVFAGALVVQVLVWRLAWAPISPTALGVEATLWLIGLMYYRKMN
jgi:hypothetical protein